MKPPRPLLYVLTTLLLVAPAALAQQENWCGTPGVDPAPPVPAGFQPGSPVPIPIAFHVVYGRDPQGNIVGNIPDSMMVNQVGVLNQEFADTGFSFFLLSISRLEEQDWHGRLDDSYREPGGAGEHLNVAPSSVMNVYVGNGTGGLTTIPGVDTPGIVGTGKDGVFVNWQAFPGSAFPTQNSGDVAVHEVGHYFGLPHTWGNKGVDQFRFCTTDDGFTDTGFHKGPNTADGCDDDPLTPLPNNCVDPDTTNLPDPVFNFMNYNDEDCLQEFTSQQNARQQVVRYGVRAGLGLDIPAVYDTHSPAVTFNDHTFSGQHIYILPGADVTLSGDITLEDSARVVVVGGADLDAVTGLDLQDGSTFTVRSFDVLALGDVTVADGSVLRLGQAQTLPDDETFTGGGQSPPLFRDTPSLSVAGTLTVADPGSTLDVGDRGLLSLGVGGVARFENGGYYATQGTTLLGDDAVFVMEPDAAIPTIATAFDDSTFVLGRDARLVFRNGGYTLEGFPGTQAFPSVPLTIHRLDANEAWDAVVFEGDNITLRNATVEGGTTGAIVAGSGILFDDVLFADNVTGVKVYDPGSGEITSSEIRGSTVGLDVRSSAGFTVDGSTIEDNVTGVRGDFIDCYGASSCPCFTSCRSDLDLVDSVVRDNAASGVYITDADADIIGTEVRDNGSYGLYVSNGLVEDFRNNLVIGNGANGLGNGIFISAGGDFFLSPEFEEGLNRVAHNNDEELYVYSSGFAFLGDSFDTGQNAIFDAQGGVLVANPTKPSVDANYIYWGASSGPPSGAISGFVDTALSLACDLISPPDPNDPAPCSQSRGTGPEVAAAGHTPGSPAERGGLGAAIRAVRSTLAADPASPEAAGLVHRLASLHRRDRADAEGERAASFGLLRALRARLNNSSVSSELRATAEAAAEIVAVDALTMERYEEAAGAVQSWRERVESPEVLRVLALVEASLEARAERYAEAGALVASVAADEPDESAARGLASLAAHYTALESGGEGARGSGTSAAVPLTEAGRISGAGSLKPRLAAYPNPLVGSSEATVALTLDTPNEARVVVYDVLGREVATLHAGELAPGTHTFALDGRSLPAGLYLIRAESGSHRFTERLTVVR